MKKILILLDSSAKKYKSKRSTLRMKGQNWLKTWATIGFGWKSLVKMNLKVIEEEPSKVGASDALLLESFEFI